MSLEFPNALRALVQISDKTTGALTANSAGASCVGGSVGGAAGIYVFTLDQKLAPGSQVVVCTPVGAAPADGTDFSVTAQATDGSTFTITSTLAGAATDAKLMVAVYAMPEN